MANERYSRSNRDDRDSSVDRSPEREGRHRNQVRDRDGDSKRRDSDHYRPSRRDDREEERDRGKDRARDREGSRDRDKHHERSKDKEGRSKRKEREEENGNREGKKKSRFADGSSERRSSVEDVAEGSGAMNGASGVEIEGAASYSSTALETTSLAPRHTLPTKMEEHRQQLGKVAQARLLMH